MQNDNNVTSKTWNFHIYSKSEMFVVFRQSANAKTSKLKISKPKNKTFRIINELKEIY